MVTCAGLQQHQYTGYQIEVMRAVAADLGWQDDEWSFACMDW
jgi:ABC-type amino acid transport substrate-binding protein